MSSSASNVTRLPNRDTALKALYDDVSAKHMFPFWATSTDVEHDEVKQLLATPKAIPYPVALRRGYRTNPRSGRRIGHDGRLRAPLADSGESGPGAAARDRVSTMYTAYRLNDANEIMPPHRHSPSAIRFGLKGKGNFTGVDGENIVFGPGDMVLTPNDTWHNHGTVGNETGAESFGARSAAGRDAQRHSLRARLQGRGERQAGLQEAANARFSPDYSQRTYGYGGLLPRFAGKQVARRRHLLADVRLSLGAWCASCSIATRDNDGDAHDGLMVEYIDPTNGQPVFKTITFFVQMLQPGQKTLPVKTTVKPAGLAVRGQGLFDRRRQAVRLERIRHAWRCPAVPGSSTTTRLRRSRCSCSSPATSRR